VRLHVLWKPTLKPNLTSAFVEADSAEKLLVIGEIAKLGVSHATFRALKMPVSGSH